MNEADKTPTPVRNMYTLVDAAVLTGCSVDDLLQRGVQGSLPILARVPDHVVVYSTNQSILDLASPVPLGVEFRRTQEFRLYEVVPLVMRNIQLLRLAESDCDLVASHGEAFQAIFQIAAPASGEAALILAEPPALAAHDGYGDMRPFRRFACYSVTHNPFDQDALRTAPTKIKLTIDILRVRSEDLISQNLLRMENIETIKFDNGFKEEPYMSRRLLYLNEGAWKFWNCATPGWSEPVSRDVAEWFISKCGFEKKLAERAARILRESYKSWNQDEYELGNKKNMFNAVVEIAGRWKNADLGDGDRAEQLDTYPDQLEALEFLKIKCGFADYTAHAAWLIALPEKAKTLGRPRI